MNKQAVPLRSCPFLHLHPALLSPPPGQRSRVRHGRDPTPRRNPGGGVQFSIKTLSVFTKTPDSSTSTWYETRRRHLESFHGRLICAHMSLVSRTVPSSREDHTGLFAGCNERRPDPASKYVPPAECTAKRKLTCDRRCFHFCANGGSNSWEASQKVASHSAVNQDDARYTVPLRFDSPFLSSSP